MSGIDGRLNAAGADALGWASVRECHPSVSVRWCSLLSAAVLRIGSIVLRVDDLRRQTEFWQAALGYVRRDDGKSDDFTLLGPADGVGPHLSLDQVRAPLQIPPRLHLDLYTEDQ